MYSGYFIASKEPSGKPGLPIGDEETGAIMVFDDLQQVRSVRDKLPNSPTMKIFKLSMSVVGEVIA